MAKDKDTVVVFVYDGESIYDESAVDTDAAGKPSSPGYERYEIPKVITLTSEDIINYNSSVIELLRYTNQAKRL
jgi:hypothetical protein